SSPIQKKKSLLQTCSQIFRRANSNEAAKQRPYRSHDNFTYHQEIRYDPQTDRTQLTTGIWEQMEQSAVNAAPSSAPPKTMRDVASMDEIPGTFAESKDLMVRLGDAVIHEWNTHVEDLGFDPTEEQLLAKKEEFLNKQISLSNGEAIT